MFRFSRANVISTALFIISMLAFLSAMESQDPRIPDYILAEDNMFALARSFYPEFCPKSTMVDFMRITESLAEKSTALATTEAQRLLARLITKPEQIERVAHPADPQYALDIRIHHPALFAAAIGNGYLIEFIGLETIPLNNFINPYNGLSVFHYAAYYNQPGMSWYLATIDALEREEPIDLDIMDGQSNTQLHIAAKQGHAHYVRQALITGARANARNGTGQTPFALAANEETRNVITEHLQSLTSGDQSKKNAFATGNTSRDMAFIRAIEISATDQEATIKTEKLLKQHDLNVNAQDINGCTALHLAAKKNFESTYQCLLKRKDININARDNENHTAKDYGLEETRQDVATGLVNVQTQTDQETDIPQIDDLQELVVCSVQ